MLSEFIHSIKVRQYNWSKFIGSCIRYQNFTNLFCQRYMISHECWSLSNNYKKTNKHILRNSSCIDMASNIIYIQLQIYCRYWSKSLQDKSFCRFSAHIRTLRQKIYSYFHSCFHSIFSIFNHNVNFLQIHIQHN